MQMIDSAMWIAHRVWRMITRGFRPRVPVAARAHGDRLVVFHVVKTLAPEYGGPARAVQGLVAALEEAGVETHLVSIEPCDSPWVDGVAHCHCLNARGYRDVYRKMCALIDELRPDIIHTNDCWLPILNMCHQAARDKGVRYVISPHGSLKRWSRRQKWLKKWIALKTYEGYDIRHAAALHVTADDEREHVAELGLNDNIFKVTNGLTFPADEELAAIRRAQKPRTKKRALFLSRIHYTKGLINLVEAWAKARPSGWELEIVGTDADGYQAQVEKRVRELGLKDVIFSGPASEKEKWTKYLGADLFVLPTFTENFGIVIAEALYAGVPVITTKGAPWEDLVKEKCGWWIDIGVEPLVAALKEAVEVSEGVGSGGVKEWGSEGVKELREMGKRGHELVARKFSWPALGRKMKEEYEKVVGGRCSGRG